MQINRLAVDLYQGDTVTDFRAVYASGIRLVIHKASEGHSLRDPKYAERRNAAKAAGLMWGAYHFGHGGDVNSQVAIFLSAANPDADTRLVLDWETVDMDVATAREFLATVDRETGRSTILYSYSSFLREQLAGKRDTFFGLHPLWLAQYSNVPPIPQVSWDKVFLWQYTDGVSGPEPKAVPGISGAVDCNHYAGTEADLRAMWLADATKPVAVASEPWDSAAWQMFGAPRSPQLAWVQSTLNSINPTSNVLVVDGLAGPLTTNAVRAFQRARGLTPDGIAGPITAGELQRVLNLKGASK